MLVCLYERKQIFSCGIKAACRSKINPEVDGTLETIQLNLELNQWKSDVVSVTVTPI
jgi:hypothetical protein